METKKEEEKEGGKEEEEDKEDEIKEVEMGRKRGGMRRKGGLD